VLGRPDLFTDAYDTGEAGERARAEFSRLFAQHPLSHWRERFAGKDLCVEPVLEGDEILEDPQLRARGLFVESEDTQRGRKVTHLLTPLRLGEPPLHPAPTLGQHNHKILVEAGFSPEEIERLVK
jgi:crotonobetainyl-CoA:carnitine CoA-transferase CaiB-like acyl-CoA transferase